MKTSPTKLDHLLPPVAPLEERLETVQLSAAASSCETDPDTGRRDHPNIEDILEDL